MDIMIGAERGYENQGFMWIEGLGLNVDMRTGDNCGYEDWG